MERTLLITEEVLRHLVTRDERPARPARRDGSADGLRRYIFDIHLQGDDETVFFDV
jgi:protocatechuate 3,4-dioxygenase alpha subunit